MKATASLLSLFFCTGLAAQPARIRARIDSTRRVGMAGHVHPRAGAGNDRARMDATAQLSGVTLAFEPTPDQQAELESLLVRQRTPGSQDYHRWLTPDQYAERFGLGESDLAAVTGWLQDQGLTVTSVARSRTSVSVSGPVGRIERAFQTELHRYRVEGQDHFANSMAPSLPLQLQRSEEETSE